MRRLASFALLAAAPLVACREREPVAPATIVAVPIPGDAGSSAVATDDPPKRRTPPKQSFQRGAAVEVEWRGTWYAAEVLELVPPESYRIHYDGYGDEWDETVGPARIRARRPAGSDDPGAD